MQFELVDKNGQNDSNSWAIIVNNAVPLNLISNLYGVEYTFKIMISLIIMD